MEQAAIVGALVLAGGSILAWVKFWMDQGKQAQRVESATAIATTALGQAEVTKSRLHDFEVRASQEFATHKALAGVEERNNTMMQEFRRDIRGLSERLDRVLDKRGEE